VRPFNRADMVGPTTSKLIQTNEFHSNGILPGFGLSVTRCASFLVHAASFEIGLLERNPSWSESGPGQKRRSGCLGMTARL
jgi:hypothetical protein